MSSMEERRADASASGTALIQRILAGEKDLFHSLIRPYERGFFLQAFSILRNQDDAEEAVQQAMIKIYTNLSQLTQTDKFKRWAMRVVENEAKMYRRKRRQHLYESIDDGATEAPDDRPFRPRQFADWRDLPSDEVERSEVRTAVAKALAELPDMYSEVFVLREMQHLDLAETMEVLGISESAVKTRLHRARLMLREALTPFFAKPQVSLWARWKGVNPWLAARR
ncbi:MAG: sigma-70 family RNA polymerase sigma factor [Alphaproteobacteria bacterium]|nr:sigma-70 family RNA polymerase sigma factor [Alphaproteobacteria bacterium]